MRMKTLVTGLTAALAMGFVMAMPIEVQAFEIPDGIYVGEYHLGGMTKEEASKTIQDYIDGLSDQKIMLHVDGSTVETTAGELGFHWSNPEAVDEAASAYTGGNLIKQYMARKDLEKENVRIPLETELDSGKISAFVEEKCSTATIQPQNASITRVDNAFVVTPSVVGKVVDIEATTNNLNSALEGGLDQPVEVTAVVAESQPDITTEALSTINDVLGTFSTSFSSSGAARSKNLTVGAGKINGRVLMPGETLSGYECMQPFTTKNGYATAAAYENGMVVDSVGGGVCQISTTLYNAALRAELEIKQRQNHSMIVTYVDRSADAAIAGTYKDLKFTNNYGTPIYVEGYTSGKNLTFTIYGKETRAANRTIKFVSETLSVVNPGEPIMKVDNTLPPGAKIREQSSHTGVKSRLWKYVYIDGVEKEKTLLHTDTYNASKAIYRVGPAAPVAVPDVPPTAPPETLPETPPAVLPPVEGVDGGPGVAAPGPAAPETIPGPPPEVPAGSGE